MFASHCTSLPAACAKAPLQWAFPRPAHPRPALLKIGFEGPWARISLRPRVSSPNKSESAQNGGETEVSVHAPEASPTDPIAAQESHDLRASTADDHDARSAPAGTAATAVFPAQAAPRRNGLQSFVRSLVDPVPGDPEASRFVGLLCLVQAMWTVSGILVTSYLPLYLKEVLGLSIGRIGQLESLSVLVQYVLHPCHTATRPQKTFNFGSGILGDLWSHKRIMVLGAVLFAAARPMFACTGMVYASAGAAGVLWWVSMAKLVDKVTKGFRDTPMKALIAQKAGPNKAAGLASKAAYQNLANAAGGLVASWLFAISGASYMTCFMVAIVPAVAAAFICAFLPDPTSEAEAAPAMAKAADAKTGKAGVPGRKEPEEEVGVLGGWKRAVEWIKSTRALPPAYWQAVLAFSVLYLARFEPSFVNIRVVSAGVSRALIPTLVSASMMVNFLSAKLSGAWVSCSDLQDLSEDEVKKAHLRRRSMVLATGYTALMGANVVFWTSSGVGGMLAGWLLVGLHMGLTHSLIGTTLQSYAPDKLAGTAFSLADMVCAPLLFLGNLWAGQLSEATANAGMGPVGCFGMGFVACAASGLLLVAATLFGDLGKPEHVNLGKLKRKSKAA